VLSVLSDGLGMDTYGTGGGGGKDLQMIRHISPDGNLLPILHCTVHGMKILLQHFYVCMSRLNPSLVTLHEWCWS
jgi:hypothetical protein